MLAPVGMKAAAALLSCAVIGCTELAAGTDRLVVPEVCDPAACLERGELCDALGQRCVPCPEPVDGVLQVDAAAPFEGTGAAACPVRTISAALRILEGRTGGAVHVAAGRYEDEIFPLQIRGIELRGAGAGETIIAGYGTILTAQPGGGDPTFPVLATIFAGHPGALTAISDLTIIPPRPEELGVGIHCDQGNALPNDQPPLEPSTIVERVRIGPAFGAALIATTSQDASARGCFVRLLGSDLSSNARGIWAVYSALRTQRQAIQIGDGTSEGKNVISDLDGSAIQIWDDTSYARIDGNEISRVKEGVIAVAHAISEGRNVLEVENNRISEFWSIGVRAARSLSIARLVGNEITGGKAPAGSGGRAIAVEVDPDVDNGGYVARLLYARNNLIAGNDAGIVLRQGNADLGALDQPAHDLGREDDPGNNVLRCNSAVEPGVSGGDLELWITEPLVTISAAGNQWDHLPPERSAANGGDIRFSSTRRPTVIDTGATAGSDPCPEGRFE